MHLGFDVNEYGTRISRHRCESCGQEFTLCPALDEQTAEQHWKGCLEVGCASYDEARDVDKMIAEAGGDASKVVHRFEPN